MRQLMRVAAVGLAFAMLAGCVVRPLKPYRGRVVIGQESATQLAPAAMPMPMMVQAQDAPMQLAGVAPTSAL